VNKAELVDAVAARSDVPPRTVASVLAGLEDVVAVTVKKGEKVMITGFATFERVDRKARMGRNPATGERIRVKASKGVRLSAGATLKKIVNGQTPAPAAAKSTAAKKTARTTKAVKAPAGKAPARKTRATKVVAKKSAPVRARRAAKK
jgi:DNA-binding protein HU-beta